MPWPYVGSELIAAFGVQPDAYTPVTPTLPMGIGPAPELSNNAGLEAHYSVGDYKPIYLKAGAQQSSGRLQLQMLPWSAYLLQCGIRYPVGQPQRAADINTIPWANTDLPYLTIGVAAQQPPVTGPWRWSQIFVGCKITDLSVSMQEKEAITFSVGWQALYSRQMGLVSGDLYPAPSFVFNALDGTVQSPIKWHESRFYVDSGDWSPHTQAFSWSVQNAIEAIYGGGPWKGIQPTDPAILGGAAVTVPDYRDRCPKILKETTQKVTFGWQTREVLTSDTVTFLPDTREVWLMPHTLVVQYWDQFAISQSPVTPNTVVNLYLQGAKFGDFVQKGTGPSGTVVWSCPGEALSAQIQLSAVAPS